MANHSFFNEGYIVHPVPLPPASPRLTQPAVLNKKAGLANTKLALAIDLDEKGDTKAAIDTYMAAAEIYLEAIRISQEQSGFSAITPVLTRRLEGALDRVEQLKKPNSQSRHVVEQQKAREQNREEQSSASSYTQAEISVLKRSSLIASGLFLPWSEEEAQELSLKAQMAHQSQSRSVWRDPEGDLLLNGKQKKRFWKWARPNEIAQHRRTGNQQAPIMIRSINPYSIRQQYVTDCSFIASLCICADFERRFRKRLVTSIIYPQDRDGIPIYSPEGKYMVKLWLNGVARQVIVDDRLPIDRNSNLLCSHTTGSRTQLELWVPIIEKAYMKLCGGYDFPGSNSGVDMFSLTGWIPERIFFAKDELKVRDFETAPERAWERLFSANSYGDCLITVSMSKDITEEQAEVLGLVTGHAYAVLDVIQTKDGTRLLQLKNPWASKVLNSYGHTKYFVGIEVTKC
jgi:calpain-7